jgi:hypothetical protein
MKDLTRRSQMRRLTGEYWERFGPIITGAVHD